MKKMIAMLLPCLLVMMICAGCGSGNKQTEVDLTAFFDALSQRMGWEDTDFVDVDEEMMEATYPGLADYTLRQKVMKMPMISVAVAEMAFVQCENEADAQAVAEIFRTRVEEQAAGGAWYPASMEAWEKAQVLTNGTYVALIAHGTAQEEIAEQWNALFSA